MVLTRRSTRGLTELAKNIGSKAQTIELEQEETETRKMSIND